MSTQSIGLPSSSTPAWIISGREDLTWFIGSSLISYTVLALMAKGFPILPLYVIWLFGVDGPHVWATATRTYFDRNERRKLGRLLWVVGPAMLVGPIMVALRAGPLFYVLAFTWLHYHIAKQHFGFVMLYKHKARERDRTDFLIDRYFMLASLMLPFARFIVRTNYAGFFALPAARMLDQVVLFLYVLLGAAFILRQAHKWRIGMPLNAPKLMLFGAVVPLQWLAFSYAATVPGDGLIRAGIILGLFHSFQYHRLMWFHNRNHYADPQVGQSAGVAATLAQRFVYYFGAAVLLNLIMHFAPDLRPSPYATAAMWGFPFTHYILDSKIWRVRGNKELARDLRLA